MNPETVEHAKDVCWRHEEDGHHSPGCLERKSIAVKTATVTIILITSRIDACMTSKIIGIMTVEIVTQATGTIKQSVGVTVSFIMSDTKVIDKKKGVQECRECDGRGVKVEVVRMGPLGCSEGPEV